MSLGETLASLTDEERFPLQASVAELMIRMDNNFFQYRQGLMDDDQLDVLKNAVRNRRELRHVMNIDVEEMLLSRAFKDLVKEIDDEIEDKAVAE